MTNMATSLAPALAEQVEAKAKRIEQIEGFARRIGLYMAVEIGRELSEIKELLPHGAWGDWIKERLSYSQSTASRYMKLFDEYGADQLTLLGAEPNSSTLQNISVSNALKLLALPAEERESFAEEHDVEHISARDMDKLIRERDEAQKALADTQEDAKEAISNAEEAAANARQEADKLRAELEELKNRPVDVAEESRTSPEGTPRVRDVQEPDPAALEEIRAQEAEKHRAALAEIEKKLADAEAKAAKEAEKAKKLKDKVDKAGEEAKAAMQKDMDAAETARKAAEAAKADAEARAEALEKQLKTADGDAAAFNVYFQSIQEQFNRMNGLILKADAAKAEKYRAVVRALLDSIGQAL